MAEDDNNPQGTAQQNTPTPAVKVERVVKKGDTVHLVYHAGVAGNRFGKVHADAEVTKVYPKAKAVDLIVHADDPEKSLTITRSPCDPSGEKVDSWHFPEGE